MLNIPKYKLIGDDCIKHHGRTLYRIKALKDIHTNSKIIIKKGSIGGFIEKEDNLSQEDSCWVYNDAKVFETARVEDDATVNDNTMIYGNALIKNNSYISGIAKVFDNVRCWDDISIIDSMVHGNSVIMNDAKIYSFSDIYGDVNITDKVLIKDHAVIYGNVKLYGNVIIDNLVITDSNQILGIGPIGSRNSTTYFIKQPNDIYVQCGCFSGILEKFKNEVKLKYLEQNAVRYSKLYYMQYMDAINYAVNYFNKLEQIKKEIRNDAQNRIGDII